MSETFRDPSEIAPPGKSDIPLAGADRDAGGRWS
jgi:hypothetical protein